MTRYALIDELLANRHRCVSIQDITDHINERLPEFGVEAGVTKRCVEKDINYLEFDSPFSVELERYCIDAADANDRAYSKRCLRYADPTYSIFKKKLSDDEKAMLASALNTLGSFEGLENFEWLEQLRSQLDLEERKTVISISKNLVENSTFIASLFTAIKNEQVVELAYRKFVDSEIRKVLVSPYLLKEHNRRWYVIAGAQDTGRVLNFALDRLVSADVKPGLHYKPCQEDLADRFDEIIGVTFNAEKPLSRILLWASDETKGFIRTKPLHGSQRHVRAAAAEELRRLHPSLEGGEFLTIECRENMELIRELTAWGAGLLVVEPVALRKTITKRITAMTTAYDSLG